MCNKYVCFLGASGVGKSALINALVDNDGSSAIPAGGIGPYTAHAVTVRHGLEASFRADYHTIDNVTRLLVALSKIYEPKAVPRHSAMLSKISSLIPPQHMTDECRPTHGNGKEDRNREHDNIKQANLMITGRQDSLQEISYLIDGLHAIIFGTSLFGNDIQAEDATRIETARSLIAQGTLECDRTKTAFDKCLNQHAVGYMAPSVKTLQVRVNSQLLEEGLVLVDTPGFGIEGDVYQNATCERLKDAIAVVFVVTTRGICDAGHRHLQEANIYERLFVTGFGGGEMPLKLAIAVTRVDDIVQSRYHHDRSRSKLQYYSSVCEEAEREVRQQFAGLLRNEWVTLGKPPDDIVIPDRLSRSIPVLAVAATEFRKLFSQDPDDPPFIRNPNDSNIPRLRQLLALL